MALLGPQRSQTLEVNRQSFVARHHGTAPGGLRKWWPHRRGRLGRRRCRPHVQRADRRPDLPQGVEVLDTRAGGRLRVIEPPQQRQVLRHYPVVEGQQPAVARQLQQAARLAQGVERPFELLRPISTEAVSTSASARRARSSLVRNAATAASHSATPAAGPDDIHAQ